MDCFANDVTVTHATKSKTSEKSKNNDFLPGSEKNRTNAARTEKRPTKEHTRTKKDQKMAKTRPKRGSYGPTKGQNKGGNQPKAECVTVKSIAKQTKTKRDRNMVKK